ncbi:MAG: histidine kinase [Tissierellia bacterium]|nr:histidine kinase [Tissierellia bacterium]
MHFLIDKIIIIIMSCFFIDIPLSIENLIIKLIIVIILDAIYNIYDKNLVKNSIIIAYILLMLYDRSFLYYYPIFSYSFFYDIYHKKYIIPIALSLLFLKPDLKLILVTIFSIYLSYKDIHRLKYYNRLFEIRDDLTEKNLLLRQEQNQILKDAKKNEHLLLLEERNRISRHMHDSLGHTISGTILHAEALKSGTKDEKIKSGLTDMQKNLQSGMEDIRTTLHQLKSDSIELEDKLNEIIEELNLEIRYQIRGCDKINFNLKLELISLIKECLTNVIKHSDADFVEIKLIEQKNFISLLIKDNGKKYVDTKNLKNGIGLLSLKELADRYAGNYDISYREGFRIYLNLRKEN